MDKPLKGKYRNAKVFIRVFPAEKVRWDFVKIGKDQKSICCRALQDFGKGKESNKVQNYWHYKTDGVFYNCGQKEIYFKVTSGVIDSVFKGHNIIITAYGQTGSGKSLTTLGLYNSHQDSGIAPRLIIDLFSYIKSKRNSKVSVAMSCLEITKTRFVDLFDSGLKQLDHSLIKSVSRIIMKNENQALCFLYKADGRRQISNNTTYESHKANFVITLEITIIKDMRRITSKLHVIDLVGADFYGRISCFYKELIDVATGNLAKSQLEQFLLILCEDVPAHILAKQRLNALIYYLHDSFNTQSVLRFIGHIHTNRENIHLTNSMLCFAHIILGLPPKELVSNVVETEELKMNSLQERVKNLETEKLLLSMLLNTDLAQAMTQERILHLQNVAKEYLQGATDEITIAQVADIPTFLKIFKEMYNGLKVAKEKQQNEIYEKAYAEATEQLTVKAAPSSMKQINKKYNSMKSKESIGPKAYVARKSRSNEKDQKLSLNNSLSLKDRKMSTESSQTGTKSTTTKLNRKKSSGTSTEPIQEEPIPEEAPPVYEQAYALFMKNSEYDKLSEIKKACVVAVSTANQEYIEEVRILKELTELLEKRKHELLQARMQKHFIAEPTASEIEYKCLENMIEAEMVLMTQQERVLLYQTDLKIAVDNHKRAQKALCDEFDRFCMNKFKTLIPQVGEEVILSQTIYEDVKEKTVETTSIEQESYQWNHDRLQRIRMIEQKRAISKRKEKKRWFV